MQFELIGLYPVVAQEPCHLMEMLILNTNDEIDLAGITQELPGEARENWQVPYNETYLNSSGDSFHDPENRCLQPQELDLRVAFYFHYLRPLEPLLTPSGPVSIPPESPTPSRLSFLSYEAP